MYQKIKAENKGKVNAALPIIFKVSSFENMIKYNFLLIPAHHM